MRTEERKEELWRQGVGVGWGHSRSGGINTANRVTILVVLASFSAFIVRKNRRNWWGKVRSGNNQIIHQPECRENVEKTKNSVMKTWRLHKKQKLRCDFEDSIDFSGDHSWENSVWGASLGRGLAFFQMIDCAHTKSAQELNTVTSCVAPLAEAWNLIRRLNVNRGHCTCIRRNWISSVFKLWRRWSVSGIFRIEDEDFSFYWIRHKWESTLPWKRIIFSCFAWYCAKLASANPTSPFILLHRQSKLWFQFSSEVPTPNDFPKLEGDNMAILITLVNNIHELFVY